MMTKLAIRGGYMNKRNEQAVWQRRYCVLVPHTFLYYYEHEDSDSPRGIIDLEFFTDISADDKNIVKVSLKLHAPSSCAAASGWWACPC